MADSLPLIDRLIGYFSPEKAMRRAYFREQQATYRGAVRTRLDTGWTNIQGGATRQVNRLLREDFRSMRSRARDLERNNVLAGAVLDRATENVIGGGIRVKPMSSSAEFNAAVLKSWKKWSKGKTADVRHMHTFGALQQLAYRAKIRDGDTGVLLTEEKDLQGRSHPRLQIVEGEHIDSPLGGVKDDEGNPIEIIDGIELGENDQATGYYLVPRDNLSVGKPTRIRSRDFIYLCRPSLYSSVRGESSFNGAWMLFDQIVGYLESVVVAARVAASQAALVTRNNPASAISSMPTLTSTPVAGEPRKAFPVEPGMVHFLAAGEEVKGFNPTQPTQSMEAAVNTFCRFVGLRFGLTIEQVLLNFSQTSYSSSRAARLQAEATALKEQEDFAATFFSRVYPWAVAKWINAGIITVPMPTDGTAWDFEWIPQARPWIDPTKEIRAAGEAIALGLDARQFIASERGYDFDQLVAANQTDVAKLMKAGLPTDPNGGVPAPAVTVNDTPFIPAPNQQQPQDATNG